MSPRNVQEEPTTPTELGIYGTGLYQRKRDREEDDQLEGRESAEAISNTDVTAAISAAAAPISPVTIANQALQDVD